MHDKLINTNERDIRLNATIWIWSLSAPLFFICIPIIALTETGIIVPFFVLGSTVISTISVWLLYGRSVNLINSEVKQLQNRIENLEAIAGHGHLDSEFKILESKEM